MRTPNRNTVSYAPKEPPSDPAQLQRYLRDELAAISTAIQLLAAGRLDKLTVAPLKPRDGDWAYADGTLWNPGGSGKGIYMYTTVWTLVKTLP